MVPQYAERFEAIGQLMFIFPVQDERLNWTESMNFSCCCCGVSTLKMARKPVKLQKGNPAGCAGEVNRIKDISRREKDGLKMMLGFSAELTVIGH